MGACATREEEIMVLTVDIGNTNIVIGAFEKGELAFFTRTTTASNFEADQFAAELYGVLSLYKLNFEQVEGIIISSVVVPLTATISRALKTITGVEPYIFKTGAYGLGISIDNPAELGADIYASCIAAKDLYAMPCIVIDMGTATTLTAMDKNGDIAGVSIMPGVRIALDALISRASALGSVSIDAPKHAIGTNTKDSIKSGIVYGTAAMLDGMIARFAYELGGCNTVVATGGLAAYIAPHCASDIVLADELLLQGLYKAFLLEHAKK